MSDRLLTIRTAENGFLVEVTDKKIQAKNEKSNSPFVDPDREFVLSTPEEVTALVTKVMAGVDMPKSDEEAFEAAFEEATTPTKGAKKK